jgi:hypothetical protein
MASYHSRWRLAPGDRKAGGHADVVLGRTITSASVTDLERVSQCRCINTNRTVGLWALGIVRTP